MNVKEFNAVRTKFEKANVTDKIKIYTSQEGLTESQYKQLLRKFPIEHLDQLEAALK